MLNFDLSNNYKNCHNLEFNFGTISIFECHNCGLPIYMFYVLDECIPQTMGWVFASLTEKSSSSARRWSAMYRTPSRARRRHGEKDRLGSDTRLVSFAGRWHRFITCPNCWSSYFRSKGSESDRCRDVADGEEMDVDIPLPNPNSMSWQFSPSTSVSWWSQLLGVLRLGV